MSDSNATVNLDECSVSSVDELLDRLKSAKSHRVDYPEGSPTLRYCLRCDEFVLRIWDDEEEEFPELDCIHKHFDSILSDSHDNPEISDWITCLQSVKNSQLL